MADQSADDRQRRAEASLPFSPRVPAEDPAKPRRRKRIRVKRLKSWVSAAVDLAPDVIRAIRKILADGATLY